MTEPTLDRDMLEQTVQAERLRLHRVVSASSVMASAAMGVLLMGLLSNATNHLHLLLWITALCLALMARVAVWMAHVRADPQPHHSARWLLRYRLCFLAHGLAWSLAGLLLLPTASHSQLDLLAMSLFAISAGSLLATAFDITAAAAFVLPTLIPLLVHFFTRGEEGFSAMGLVVLVLSVVGMVSARRTQGIVQESVRLRLAEARSADDARRSAAAAEQAQREMAEQHYLLPLLLRTTQQGFWYIDNAGLTIDLNPAMCELLGRSREEVLGQSVFGFFDAENLQIMGREIAARQAGKTGGYEISITRPDGSQVHCFNNATPIHDGHGTRIGSIGLWTDISARKRAEQQLLQATAQLRRKSEDLQLTLDSIDQGIVTIDPDRRIGVHNRRMLELLELPASLVTSSTSYDDAVRFQRERGDFDNEGNFVDVNGQHVKVGDGGLDLPPVYVRRFRSGAMVEVRSRRLVGGGLVRTFTDVTAYVGALDALRQRETEQRMLLDAFPGYIAVVDQDYVYQYVNARLATLVGFPSDQLIGRHLRDVVGPAVFEQLALAFEHAAAGRSAILERNYPATTTHPHMSLELQHVAGPLKPDGKRLFYVFGNDVTARKHAEAQRISLEAQLQESKRLEAVAALEAQLRESQKMEAVGTLAGGIAHDFNNIIATILGNTELARLDVQSQSLVLESLDEIRKAGSRARDLVQQILSFSRRQPTTRALIPLAPVITESLRLLRATLPARVALEADLDTQAPPVLADATQIQQVLINLITNAVQAMQGRPGRVDVRLTVMSEDALANASEPVLQSLRARHAGRVVKLSVNDNGPGMKPEVLGRVFEPFFTTKPSGEGTGLGLSVVHGIVHGHEGEITVESTPGVGTRFVLYLPDGNTAGVSPASTRPEFPALTELSENSASPPGAGPRLLYVDDEESLVFLVKRIMERRGWRVSAHINQRDALNALQADPLGYDLLVADYNMPGMSGLDVVRAARNIQPDLLVAVVSGFIDDELRMQADKAEVHHLIFKASAMEDFCNAIHALAVNVPSAVALQ